MINFKLAHYDSQTQNWIEKNIWEVMDPSVDWHSMSEEQQLNYAYNHKMLPTSYKNNGETYCRNADRTANNELNKAINVNYKSKVEFVWAYMKPEHLTNILTFCQFKDNYKNEDGEIVPIDLPTIKITYRDFLRVRTIDAYLGQSIDSELVEYEGTQYWTDIRLAFPEK